MIRFLQQDNQITKILFGVIIGAACISMVVFLVPGLMDNLGGGTSSDTYATVHAPGFWGRIFGASDQIKTTDVSRLAQRQLQQQQGITPDMARMLMPLAMNRAGVMLVQRAVLKQEADRLHLQVSDDDLRTELRTGPFSQYLFPNGKFIGDDGYANFVQMVMGPDASIAEFEEQIKEEMELQRLQALVTGGITVSDTAVRDAYRVQGTKIKFDYAVISLDDIKNTINPSDADLQAFFKQSSARYANAIPETRKIEYVAFDASKLPGGKPQITPADIQAYYNAHQDNYKTEEQVKTRHILISVPTGADAKTDAAAKAKAQDVLNQLKAGGNFADLAKKFSDDPGSKDQGGELPMVPTAQLDPAYAKAAMALAPGQTSGLVRSQFGYHIIQTEQKQPAGVKPLADVKDSITQILEQQKAGSAEQQFASQLAADARANGLDKAAASRGLKPVTTDYVAKDGVIGGLSDGSALLAQAFTTDKGAAPATVSTGDGYAVFQVLDVKPSHAPDFASYKSHILDDYRSQKAPELMEQEARKLDDRAKVLNDLRKAAAEFNVTVKSSDLVGQDGQVPDLGSMAGPGAPAFKLNVGGISAPIYTGESDVVLELTDKQQPTPDEVAKNFDQMREQLLDNQRNQMFSVFVGTLAQKYQDGGGIRLSKQAQSPSEIPGT
ncbi:MAG TPA: peptidyl-prolyl cis-trans isomerase [Acidobacteriaceae bacterium]|nr:peptidyl-prolyl cis-trans isomerase [Acidobacteriaceae bacterium]